MGVVGLETAFPVLYTGLVKTGIMSLETLVQRMSAAPRARFALPRGEDYSIWDLEASYPIDPAEFQTMGRATPFAGGDGLWPLQSDCGRGPASVAGPEGE